MLRMVSPPPSPGAHPMAGGTPAMGALAMAAGRREAAGARRTSAPPAGARFFSLSRWERVGVRAAPVRPVHAATPLRQFKKKVPLILMQQARAASFSIAIRCLLALSLPAVLSACAALQDAPRLSYLCPKELRFEARLYQDMALLEGLRGHAVLERLTAGPDGAALRYADPTVRAQFGLGVDARLVRLDYTNIPEPVYCERAATADQTDAPVRAHARPGPRPAPPFDPNAPVQTNIRIGDGNNGPG